MWLISCASTPSSSSSSSCSSSPDPGAARAVPELPAGSRGGLERHLRNRAVALVLELEEVALAHVREPGEEPRGEALDLDVEVTHGHVVEAPGGLDLVLGVRELVL